MNKSGVVNVITGPNKGGYYSFKIEGDDVWYGIMNKVSAGLEKGDNISFETEKDKRGYWGVNPDTIAKVPASQGVQGGVAGRESYWQDKAVTDVANHREIRWRSAVNTAVQVVELAEKMDANPVPKTGAKGKRYDALLALVNETALGIYESYASANREEGSEDFSSVIRLVSGDDFTDAFEDTDTE